MDNLFLRKNRVTLVLSLLIGVGGLLITGCSDAPKGDSEEAVSSDAPKGDSEEAVSSDAPKGDSKEAVSTAKRLYKENILPLEIVRPAYLEVKNKFSFTSSVDEICRNRGDIMSEQGACKWLLKKCSGKTGYERDEEEKRIGRIIKSAPEEVDLNLIVHNIERSSERKLATVDVELQIYDSANPGGMPLATDNFNYRVKEFENGRETVEIGGMSYTPLSELPENVDSRRKTPEAGTAEVLDKLKKKYRKEVLPLQFIKPAYAVVGRSEWFEKIIDKSIKNIKNVQSEKDVCIGLLKQFSSPSKDITDEEKDIRSIIKEASREYGLNVYSGDVVEKNEEKGITIAKGRVDIQDPSTTGHTTEHMLSVPIKYKVKQEPNGGISVRILDKDYKPLPEISDEITGKYN